MSCDSHGVVRESDRRRGPPSSTLFSHPVSSNPTADGEGRGGMSDEGGRSRHLVLHLRRSPSHCATTMFVEVVLHTDDTLLRPRLSHV